MKSTKMLEELRNKSAVELKEELVTAKKCSYCKLHDVDKCEGQQIIKGANVFICPQFMDKRASGVIPKELKIPFPKEVKKK